MGVVHVLTGPDHLSVSKLSSLPLLLLRLSLVFPFSFVPFESQHCHFLHNHTQALATLSSSSSSVSKCYLFGLGARWGIGHSTGLMLVGGFFILKDVLQNNHDDNESDDSDGKRLEIPDAVTHLFESFVGIFMLTLGFYGIYEARKIRYNGYTVVDRSSSSSSSSSNENTGEGDDVFVNDPISNNNNNNKLRPLEVEATEIDSHSDDGYGGDSGGPHRRQDYTEPDDDLEEFRYNIQVMFGTVSTEETANANEASGGDGFNNNNHRHSHNHDHSNSSFLACCAGIFHGLAGPGGVLGVVPAIQLHDPLLAICYLLSFCTTSIITMGTFSSAYGTFTTSLARCISSKPNNNKKERSSRILTTTATSEKNSDDDDDRDDLEVSSLVIVEFWIRCVSASMSLLVGVTWLVLLAMGKLEDIMGRR